MPCRRADLGDRAGEVVVDIVVDRQPAVGAARVAPVDDIEVDAEPEEVAHQRPVLLQVGHGVAPDEPVDDQDRGLHLGFGERAVAVEGDLVLAPDLVLGRRRDRDVLVPDLAEELRAFGDPLAEIGDLAHRLRRVDRGSRSMGHGVASWRLPLRRLRATGRAGVSARALALQGAEFPAQLGHGLVDVVELGPGRIAEHLAVVFGKLALGEPEVGRGLEGLALRLQERLRALRLEQRRIRRLDPERQHLAPGLELFGLLGAPVQLLGEGAGGARPGIERHGVVLERAPAQRHPGVEHGKELALDVPQIRQPRAFGHLLQRLVEIVRARKPGFRIEDLGEHLGDERIGGRAALHCFREVRRNLGRRRPQLAERAALPPRTRPIGGRSRGPALRGGAHLLGHVAEHARCEARKALPPCPHRLASERMLSNGSILGYGQTVTTWRTTLPCARRSKPSLISSSRRCLLISRSTGSLPRR